MVFILTAQEGICCDIEAHASCCLEAMTLVVTARMKNATSQCFMLGNCRNCQTAAVSPVSGTFG